MVQTLKNNLSFMLALGIILGAVALGALRQQWATSGGPLVLFEERRSSDEPLADSVGLIAPDTDLASLDEDAEMEDAAEAAVEEPVEQAMPEDLVQGLERLQQALTDGRLFSPEGDSAAWWVDSVLRVNPDQAEGREALTRLIDELTAFSAGRLPAEDMAGAERTLALLQRLQADAGQVAAVQHVIDSARELAGLIERGERLLAREGASAQTLLRAGERFKAALAIDDANPAATKGVETVQRRLVEVALAASQDYDFQRADTLIEQARALQERSRLVDGASAQLMAFRAQSEAELLAQFDQALDERDVATARSALERLRKFLGDERRLRSLDRKISNAELYAGYSPGETFADTLAGGGRSPRVVVIPVGRFVMGSPESEPGRERVEGPQRELRFTRGFALAQSEISVAEFRRFVEATNYVTDAEREGSSATYDERGGRLVKRRGVDWRRDFRGSKARDADPVVHVSWNDATAYARWLSDSSGKIYRLPTEAEFEYALRAGTQTVYWWGDGAPDRVVANLTGSQDISKGRHQWTNAFPNYGDGFWGPAPVRSYEANPFGLYDIDGNVSEWVEDCWHDSYRRAPEEPVAWVNAGCEARVVRGGSWGSAPEQSRSAYRIPTIASGVGGRVGFRVARELGG
ncbi:MAG: SUMF1/EgtB/PvdO family nonheme iron enzyme [Xanthomonadales bacterium]|nr:SUMF1/EgtB/PvdO family nonheme iron enzyme [Xanthomonadales bacterium]